MKGFLAAVCVLAALGAAWWALGSDGAAPPSDAARAGAPEQVERRPAEDQPAPTAPESGDAGAARPGRSAALDRNERALELLAGGEWAEAEALFAAAAALDPDEPVFRLNLSRARVRLGRAAWERGEGQEALRWFGLAADADADGGAPAEWRAAVLLRLGERAAAAAAVDEALVRFPDSPGLLRQRAELAFLRGDVEAAAADARAALEREDTPAARERAAQLEEEARAYRSFLTDATAHFDSRYDPQDAALVARMPALHAELERAWSEVVGLLGVQPEQRLLVLWLRPERWRGSAPVWSAGLYDGRVRLLVRDGPGEEERLRATLRHELTHALLHALGARLPTWLHEGLAQRAEGRSVEAARRTLRGREPRLQPAALDGDWTSWQDEALLDEAYATALSLVLWLEERAGANALPSLLLGARGAGFEGAWAAVFARPFPEWEREHAAWIRAGG